MQKSRVVAPTPAPFKVWTRELAEEAEVQGKSSMPRVWEEFMHGAHACFWGLGWDEGMLARRLASQPILNAQLRKEDKVDEDMLQLCMVMLSARQGDGEEFAYDPSRRFPPSLLNPTKIEDIELIKRHIPGGRLRVLAQMVDQLSTISLPKISEQVLFFQAVISCSSGLLSSAIPSLEELLRKSLPDNFNQADQYLQSIRDGLVDMSGLAETLLLGLSIPERSTQKERSPNRSRTRLKT